MREHPTHENVANVIRTTSVTYCMQDILNTFYGKAKDVILTSKRPALAITSQVGCETVGECFVFIL